MLFLNILFIISNFHFKMLNNTNIDLECSIMLAKGSEITLQFISYFIKTIIKIVNAIDIDIKCTYFK